MVGVPLFGLTNETYPGTGTKKWCKPKSPGNIFDNLKNNAGLSMCQMHHIIVEVFVQSSSSSNGVHKQNKRYMFVAYHM